MNDQSLSIETLNVPENVKSSIKALSSQYTFQKFSPKGANGYLFFAYDNVLKRRVAIKYYYWGGDPEFHAEPRQLSKIDSEFVLKIYNAGLIDGEMAYFVTPFCKNGDLDDYIANAPLGLKSGVDIGINILSGITCLHSNRFVHRDLKPQNILIGDDHKALIGDFGSVRYIPKDQEAVPGSGHAILYRPPESFQGHVYSFQGDIYQVGIVLYQLLGGYLPYNGIEWLNRAEKTSFQGISDNADRAMFIDRAIERRILKGSVLILDSLPPWIPDSIIRIIRKATCLDPSDRFESASAFLNRLNSSRSMLLDWKIEDGYPTLISTTSYRIRTTGDSKIYVEKKRKSGWRRENKIKGATLHEVVKKIEEEH